MSELLRGLANTYSFFGATMTTVIPVESIVTKILFVRGERVLLDRDLAELYGVKTKALKQAARRNITCFPDDFMFVLTGERCRKQLLPLPGANAPTLGSTGLICGNRKR